MTKRSASLRPRMRVMSGKAIALGPGKVDLLQAIQQTGSIREAAKSLDMSYMRAWLLIKTMEDCFKEPLVAVARGGSTHGGAALTETGELALQLYQQMEAESLHATRKSWQQLQKLFRK